MTQDTAQELSWDPEVLTVNALKVAEGLPMEDAAHIKRACEALVYGNLVLIAAYQQTMQVCNEHGVEFKGINVSQRFEL